MDLLTDLQVMQSIVSAIGTMVAAAIVAGAGLWGYGRQKKTDREYDLVRLRQQEYERFLLAFQRAGRWKNIDHERHAEAESEYHDTHNFMLLHASEEVIRTANAAHRYYVDSEQVNWRTFKRLYAEMLVAMRRDGFEKTRLSAEEVAANIPWTVGTEREDRGLPPSQP